MSGNPLLALTSRSLPQTRILAPDDRPSWGPYASGKGRSLLPSWPVLPGASAISHVVHPASPEESPAQGEPEETEGGQPPYEPRNGRLFPPVFREMQGKVVGRLNGRMNG